MAGFILYRLPYKMEYSLVPLVLLADLKAFQGHQTLRWLYFWGIENIDPSMDQDKGTSLVMINLPQKA